ncbi:AMP-binding protein, partial [bacterium]|nr:AMP-binding protein [candidate division CSSED10-310 bacterium]
MSHFGQYDETYRNFTWDRAREELGIKPGDPLNIGHICSDRICARGKGDKTALIWESHQGDIKRFTFDDVRMYSNTFAVFLRGLGVIPGDRVCLFMDKIPELYIGFLGILKLGAIAQPLFSAFGEESLVTRLEDAATKVVLTTKKHYRKVRRIREQLPHLEWIVVLDEGAKLQDGEMAFSMYEAPYREEFTCHQVDEETPSVLHYTSGTTGKPKGALHVHGSILSQFLTSKWVLDLRDDDVYWCTADPGWVTGTSYGIIGPWSNGVTQTVLDAGFSSDKWYAFIARHKVTVWYSAPTAIRLLMRDGEELVRQHDLSSLRHLCSVGEPLNPEAVIWSEKAYGLAFHDTFWQTETGAMVITNLPGMKIKPGSMGKPFFGITAAIIHPETYTPVATGEVGLIGLKPPWPSMFRTYWNNE